MTKFYVTFGQVHRHIINDKIFDKDCVCELEAIDSKDAHNKAMMLFSARFCTINIEPSLKFYPRGIIKF